MAAHTPYTPSTPSTSSQFSIDRELLMQWFTPQRWALVYPILNNTDPDRVSLRLLEFLTSHYARKNEITYYIERNGKQRLINMFLSIQSHTLAKRKKNMEPFARSNGNYPERGRFEFGHDNNKCTTSIAQLNYLRFVLEYAVLKWLRKHLNEVTRAKVQFEQEQRTRKRSKRRRESDTTIMNRKKRMHQMDLDEVKRLEARFEARAHNRRRRPRKSAARESSFSIQPVKMKMVL